MRNRKNIFCLVFVLVLPYVFSFIPYAFSQVSSLSPQLIGSTGNYSTAVFGSISSSVGEPFITTLSSGTTTLTQGFQQPLGILACPTSIGSLTLTPNNAICPGKSVTIAPSSIIPSIGSYTYSWSPGGETTSSIVVNPTITTVYTFSVVGCTNPVQTQTVIVNPTPAPQINGSNVFNGNFCFGQDVSLNANVTSSTTGPYTYAWAPALNLSCATCANTIATSTVSGTTIYTVTVTGSNGCSGISTASVTIAPKIILNGVLVNVTCAGKCDGIAGVNPSNGVTPFTYFWSPGGETTKIIQNLCAGPYSIMATDAKGCIAAANFSITAPPPLTTSISNTPAQCGCNAAASAKPLGGTPPYSFSWSPGFATTQTITGLCGGLHNVTVTDALGCNTISSVSITPSPSITITSTSPATICAGHTTTIGVNATGNSLEYAWSNGNTTGNIIAVSPSVTTTYSVIVTNTFSGCKDTAMVPVVVNKLPVPTISANPSLSICSGYSATLTATNGINYLWSTNATTNPIAVSPSTSTGYTVTAQDVNGCSNTASVIVAITTAPTPSITASANVICRGTTITLVGSGGNSYLWSNTSQTNSVITVTPSATTTYTLVASNGSCIGESTLQVLVGSVIATISGNTNICLGDAATLSVNAIPPIGNTYLWSPGNQTSSTIIVSPTSQTTYGVMVTNNTSGCIGTETVTVQINPSPIATIATNTSTSICAGKSIILSAGPATFAYLWSTGETTQAITITPSNTGINTYTLTATQGSCSDDASININVYALPSVTASANDSTICPGDSVTLSAAALNAINYTWNPGSFSGPLVIVQPSSSITYSVTVQDNNSCSNTATVPVTFSNITVDAGKDLTICPGFTAQLNTIASGSTNTLYYLWSPGIHLNDSLIQNPSATPDSTTTFAVDVSNQDGCFGKDTVTVFVLYEAGCVIHIYNGITPNGDGDNDTWWIDGIRYFPHNNVNIFNRWGTKVWSASKYDNKDVVWKGLDSQGTPLPSGTYFYILNVTLKNGSTQTFTKWLELTR